MVRSRMVRLAVAVAACQLLSTTSAQDTETSAQPTDRASLSSQMGLVSATLPPTPISISTRTVSRSAAASASSEPQVHLMKVGSGGFKFTPQELTNVSVGDTVTFEFYPPDHSVIQAEFGSACVPYSYADKDHAGKGFWTETQWVNDTSQVSVEDGVRLYEISDILDHSLQHNNQRHGADLLLLRGSQFVHW
ncbi:hypothetical protein OPT61_g5590 [Boeremia exigua]|uniref:Uncharacterized protein n=1 Tax=Boeremia exigua TaxID=749465 RepID=A0ACC2I9Q8_9PLEO|nr:hypothetical protein OPT61_g5590 [Boeremia exigua]